MSIKISLVIYDNNLEYEAEVTTEKYIVEDLNLNLVGCIQHHLGGDRFLSFSDYYTNSYAMLHQRVLPFIIRNGRYYLYVSYKDVTIMDFMITNNIPDGGTIRVEVDKAGGLGAGTASAILSWILAIGGSVGYFEFYYKGLAFICKHFIGENRQRLDFYDVADMIHRKIVWKLDDLMCDTGWSDMHLVEILLDRSGYRYVNGEFVFDEQYWDDMLEDLYEKNNPWAVEFVYDEYQWLSDSLESINRSISAIKYIGEDDSCKYYNKVRGLADQLRARWPKIICRGRQFCCLRVRKNPALIDEDRLKKLEYDASDVSLRISELVDEYDEMHRPTVDFDPPMVG